MSAERLVARHFGKLKNHSSDFAIELLNFIYCMRVKTINKHSNGLMKKLFIEKFRKYRIKMAMSTLDNFSNGRYS